MAKEAAIVGPWARAKRVLAGALLGGLFWAGLLAAIEWNLGTREPGACFTPPGLEERRVQLKHKATIASLEAGALCGAVGGAVGMLFVGTWHWLLISVGVGINACGWSWAMICNPMQDPKVEWIM